MTDCEVCGNKLSKVKHLCTPCSGLVDKSLNIKVSNDRYNIQLNIPESRFTCHTMDSKTLKVLDGLYFYVGTYDGHTVIILPENSADVEEWQKCPSEYRGGILEDCGYE